MLRSSEKKASICAWSPEVRRMAGCAACCPPLLWLARPFGLLPPFPVEEVRPGADVERPVEREGCPATTASAPARPRVDSTDGVVRLRDWLFM